MSRQTPGSIYSCLIPTHANFLKKNLHRLQPARHLPVAGGTMRTTLLPALVLLLPGGLSAAEVSVFRGYVDSDLCARLMLGPITPSRIECSQSTVKEGS